MGAISDVSVAAPLIGAVAFLLLTLALLTAWRGRGRVAYLIAACALTTAWCICLALYASVGVPSLQIGRIFEIIRDGAWFLFFIQMLPTVSNAQKDTFTRGHRELISGLIAIWVTALVIVVAIQYYYGSTVPPLVPLVLSIIGLVLVEQAFRSTPLNVRWRIKFLCLGVGGIFVYDIVVYSDAVLFQRLHPGLWDARGLVTAMAVPLIAVSVARNPNWDVGVHISRRILFHTTTLLATGIYLLLIAVAGYYVKLVGGSWGAVLQIAVLFGAALLLGVLLLSEQMRAKLRVFLSRHFFNYRYDYRDEWLRFTRTVAGEHIEDKPAQRIIRSLAQIVESRGGILWTLREGKYQVSAVMDMDEPEVAAITDAANFVTVMREHNWVINLDEPDAGPERQRLTVPAWLQRIDSAWLVVPLRAEGRLAGFVVLADARTHLELNWEDYDLLKVAGNHAANYLLQLESAEALAQARQFQVFTQTSAFIMHDLKNLVVQLSLLVANARHHKSNPEFVDDMVNTIDNAANRMNRLLARLRHDNTAEMTEEVDLAQLVREVVAQQTVMPPAPAYREVGDNVWVYANRERLTAVISHIVQNSQEATGTDGRVKISLSKHDGSAHLVVEDNGCGMDKVFLRERLFRPFDSTKGLTGMGVGAFECREYVRELGGEVDVESKPRSGTSFHIKIPLVKTSSAICQRGAL